MRLKRAEEIVLLYKKQQSTSRLCDQLLQRKALSASGPRMAIYARAWPTFLTQVDTARCPEHELPLFPSFSCFLPSFSLHPMTPIFPGFPSAARFPELFPALTATGGGLYSFAALLAARLSPSSGAPVLGPPSSRRCRLLCLSLRPASPSEPSLRVGGVGPSICRCFSGVGCLLRSTGCHKDHCTHVLQVRPLIVSRCLLPLSRLPLSSCGVGKSFTTVTPPPLVTDN